MSGYQNPNTDKSFGTHSGDVEVRVNPHAGLKGGVTNGELVKSALLRAEASAGHPDLVEVPGLGVTSRAAAIAAGIPLKDITPSVRVKGEDQAKAPVQQSAQEAEPGVSMELAEAANRQLDQIEQHFSPNQLQGVTHAAAHDLDPRALEAIGGNDSPLVQSYIERGLAWAAEQGVTGEMALTDYLDPADQAKARLAVVRGDRQAFGQIVEQARRNVEAIVSDPGIIQDMREQGYDVQNGTLYDTDGTALGNFAQLLLGGFIEFDTAE